MGRGEDSVQEPDSVRVARVGLQSLQDSDRGELAIGLILTLTRAQQLRCLDEESGPKVRILSLPGGAEEECRERLSLVGLAKKSLRRGEGC